MSSSLSSQFFVALPSNVKFDNDIKEYIVNVLADVEDIDSLREVTEQFLIDAGMKESDLNSFYEKLCSAADSTTDATAESGPEKLPVEIISKLDQVFI